MKVLHVLYQSLPDVSGSSIRSRDILSAQKDLGLDVCAITAPFQPGSSTAVRWDMVAGVPHYRTWRGEAGLQPTKGQTTLWRKIRKVMTLPSFTWQVMQLARTERVDVIHAHAMFYCAFAAMIAAWRCRCPCVYEIRSAWFLEGRVGRRKLSDWLAAICERFAARRADVLVVISEGLRDLYAECKPVVVGNAVSMDVLNRRLPEVSATSHDVRFGYVGSLIPLEGIDLLLRAFGELRKRGIHNKLTIVGGGEHEGICRALARDLALDNVEFLGRVSPDQAIRAYEQIDVIVNFRRNEAIANVVTPLKPLEAMAMKRVVVVSDVGGMRELVANGVTGIVVKAEAVGALADALARLIDEPHVLRGLANGGYDFVRSQRAWPTIATKYKEVYRAAIEKLRSRSQ